ncbi:cold shock domain-containing protein C2 isoform X2 [Haplochromis burtoni]|uniref:cold shock domain-containing protein C2 isoform X2 n=1 Tax=Haplochromis burtoni TaxID=8153 RepID=UPI001C2DA3C3|nr:cold shock domain-containing protein C2 isoform X2 [Haplochromis burtoni]
MADPSLTSPSGTPLRSPSSSVTLSFPFLSERSRVWEEGREQPLPRELPSPLPTKRTRTYSATVRAHSGPVFKGVCKNFSRSQGHGFIQPSHGGEDIFAHISDFNLSTMILKTKGQPRDIRDETVDLQKNGID